MGLERAMPFDYGAGLCPTGEIACGPRCPAIQAPVEEVMRHH
jgi:hypothetical protein